ncbi:hypothetical protein [Streptomyces sp. NBC_01422]|uniref:hypothetical protein n=1 Tax=Streptomyces sp. NBC_01422 TaxID=2903859 RepID=UPI002E29AE03|nr:hypothetical protein [Streptomyces sp. NBC_01422]
MSGIYDDGATYGPDPEAQTSQDTPADPIYDDGAQYGPTTKHRGPRPPTSPKTERGPMPS